MDTFQLMRRLERDAYAKGIVVGVVPKDALLTTPTAATYPMAFVCNTDDGGEPGEHWVAVYVDRRGVGEYFDSYGLPPLHADFRAFLHRHCGDAWTYNDKRLQSGVSNVCGQYCVAYLLLRCRGMPLTTFQTLFGANRVANDCLVFDWLKPLH
ncbi:hypothetical protein DJ031_00105 [bacterium endosymbiont of Escarpia laminata]|nr:MAG: hypothetical protein DJ031_00105 [bacterium endosymbiont of Escarpia laminata]